MLVLEHCLLLFTVGQLAERTRHIRFLSDHALKVPHHQRQEDEMPPDGSRGLDGGAGYALLGRDLHHVGQGPVVAGRDGDPHRLQPDAAGRGDDRDPGLDARWRDVRRQQIGDGGGERDASVE